MSYMGKVRPTVALTSSDIVDGAVTTDKIVDDAVTDVKVANAINTSIAANTAKVTNATHTGDVTGATALTIATDAVDIAMLSATGTADATTFLRGDNAWAAAGGDNTPAFSANMTLDPVYQVIPDGASTKIQFNTEIFDTDNTYDGTTNYRWTPGVLGKYYMYTYIVMERASGSGIYRSAVYIKKNGTTIASDYFALVIDGSNATWKYVLKSMAVTDTVTNVADYYEVYVWPDTTDGADTHVYAQAPNTGSTSFFGGWKLIT